MCEYLVKRAKDQESRGYRYRYAHLLHPSHLAKSTTTPPHPPAGQVVQTPPVLPPSQVTITPPGVAVPPPQVTVPPPQVAVPVLHTATVLAAQVPGTSNGHQMAPPGTNNVISPPGTNPPSGVVPINTGAVGVKVVKPGPTPEEVESDLLDEALILDRSKES